MKIMFFDTETTGFSPPAIVQIWIIIWEYEENWKIVKEDSIDLLFNPIIEIEKQASDIHGFTFDKVKDKPYFNTFIPKFVKIVNESDLIIWHNVDFDITAIEYEIRRFYKDCRKNIDKKATDFFQKIRDKSKCTMLSSIDFCKIEWKYWKYKWPKLLELHEKLFNKSFDCVHNAMADIQATRDCYFELKKREIIN